MPFERVWFGEEDPHLFEKVTHVLGQLRHLKRISLCPRKASWRVVIDLWSFGGRAKGIICWIFITGEYNDLFRRFVLDDSWARQNRCFVVAGNGCLVIWLYVASSREIGWIDISWRKPSCSSSELLVRLYCTTWTNGKASGSMLKSSTRGWWLKLKVWEIKGR